MKKSLRAGFKRGSMAGVATLGASALLLTGCGAAPSASGPSGSATASDYTACMVSDSGGFDDKSFNQSGYEGLQSAVKDLGIQEKHALGQPVDAKPEVKVIERQVLVARCRYCEALTPVDLETCSGCRAAKFV